MFSQQSSRIAVMRVLVVALCVCSALARPENTNAAAADAAEKKSVAAARAETLAPAAVATKRAAPPVPAGAVQDTSLPNVSEDVLDKALNDRRFVQRQLKCATGEGPCDPIGRKLKANAPLVMRGMCSKCSQTEIKQVQRVMSHIQKNYPKEYAKMLKQYQSAV